MKRVTIALAALVVFAAACGGSDSNSADDVLAELDLTDAELACYTDAYGAAGLDMDTVLASDPDELSDLARQTVLDIAADCAGAEADTDDSSAADESATDDATETTTSTTEAPTTTIAEADDTETDGGENASGRTYDDLGFLERAFVDGITESGGTVEAGICILDEFAASDIDLLALAELDTDDPPPEVLSAIFACGDELLDAGIFGGLGGGGEAADTYGDDAELDALWDACAGGDFGSCDALWLQSPFSSGYEAFGNTCGERTDDQFGGCATALGGAADIDTYGDDPTFDALWDQCAGGDLGACDELWFTSPVGSGYEAFGNTCGERETTNRFGNCDSTEAMSYGEDAELDALWDACGGGDLAACDELYIFSPIGSDYEAFGNSCGGRSDTPVLGECEVTLS
ncbi:MAG: hypothetical protein AAGE98_08555 [Actinomycetota bacterium]